MKIKALCLFCLCLILSCSIVAAHDTNTTDSEIDALKTSDDTILSDETTVNATKSGIRNITFSDGYNGYCINLSKDHAEVGSVFTPKEERGNGYAYNLVYRVSKELLDSGLEYCVLFTDDANPVSNHVYEKIGYEKRAETAEILFV